MSETRRRMLRYQVPVDDQRHVVATCALPFHVAVAPFAGREVVEFWAEWREDAPQVARTYQVFGTGHEIPDNAIWAGTTARTPAGLVWHLYEITSG